MSPIAVGTPTKYPAHGAAVLPGVVSFFFWVAYLFTRVFLGQINEGGRTVEGRFVRPSCCILDLLTFPQA